MTLWLKANNFIGGDNMADTLSTSKELTIGLEYNDPDSGDKKTANFKVPNFKSSITENEIKAVFNTPVLYYGENEEGDFLYYDSNSVLTASTTNQTIQTLDIGWTD